MKHLLLAVTLMAVPAAALANPSMALQRSQALRDDSALDNISFTPPLGKKIPLNLPFNDENGATVTLGDLRADKPMLIVPVYFECPMLCTLSLNGLLKASRAIRPVAGADYTIVAVSINPKDTPALARAKKANYVKGYNRPGAESGWRFLTGDNQSIMALTDAIGFRYVYDPNSGQFGHASALAVIAPDGMITLGLMGPEFEAKDLKMSLIEASEGRIGTPIDKALMYCYSFDGSTGKYTLEIMNVLRLAGVATALAVIVFVILQIRRERRLRAAGKGGPL